MSLVGAAGEVGGKARGDGGVIHDVMERRRIHRHHPQLLRLLLSEAPRIEPRFRQIWLRFDRIFLLS